MSVFQAARGLDADDRAALLDRRCAAQRTLRREAEAMLAHDAAEGLALDTPGAAVLSREAARHDSRVFGAGASMPVLSGHYRVIRLIGEGGMGSVFEAEQAVPRRTVAIKAIRPGLVSRRMLRQLTNEAHILGRLQHPGIAQIYEAGAPDDASPDRAFIAMEYVDGLPLTEHAGTLGIPGVLHLLIRVCDAVQHAHVRGVIHRDLKPGNILVDRTGQPKILDFGVARSTDHEQTTLQLGGGSLVGTLPYMSPEQVSGDPRRIDTRTDVYALGVILYQLLAGRLPLDTSDCPIHEAVRRIRETDPPTLGTVRRELRGELEHIAARAMQKDKERRYQSAAALAEDLRRFLDGESAGWFGRFFRR